MNRPARVPDREHQAKDNTALALRLLGLAFDRHDWAGVEACLGNGFRHHEPGVAPGKAGFIDFLRVAGLAATFEPVRTVADGDLVVVHGRRSAGTTVTATIDIFRIEDGAIVEHWHVFQPVPEAQANPNGMF